MSVDFLAIEDPSFEFGNSHIIHQAILDNLRTLTNAVNDANDNSTDLATKNYVRNKNDQMRNNDNSVADSKQWTNRNDYDNTGGNCSIHLKNGTTEYVENGSTIQVASGGVINLLSGATLVTPNTTISTTEIDYLDGVSSNIQTQLDGKQASINSTTDITMNDLVCKNITCFAGTIQYSEITLNDAALTIAKTSGLQTALDAKQATISATTDLTTGNITLGTSKTFEGISKATIAYLDPTSSIQTQIDSKQATMTTGSIGDSLLASTFVKPSTDFTSGNITLATNKTISGVSAATISYLDATSSIQTQINGKQVTISGTVDLTIGNITLGTNKTFEGISKATIAYLDATSSIQNQIDGKQATITTGSIGDSLLASTFVKPSTAAILTGTNFTGIPESAVTNLTSDLAAKQATISATTDLTTGNITLGTSKTFEGISKATIAYLTNVTSDIQTQINNASTPIIADGSIADVKLASTFVKPSVDFTSGNIALDTNKTISGVNATTMSYLDATSSIQNQINGKQVTISSTVDITTGNITLGTSKTFEGISKATIAYLDPTSSIQGQIDSKQATISATTDITTGNITLGTSKTFEGISKTTLSYLDATSSIQTQLNSKQATITTGSIADDKLASTFVKTSTDQTIAGIKTFSSAPVLSGASISSATIPDGALVTTTFVKSSTAPTLTGTNFTSIPTSAISSGALTITSLSCTSETNTGNALFGSVSEKFNAITTGTNAFTLDFSTGSVFYLSSGSTLNANFSVQLNNLTSNTDRSYTVTLIYTGNYYPTSVTAYQSAGTSHITLSSSVPLYVGGSAPSFSSATVVVCSFSILRLFGSNYCVCNATNYA